MRPAGANDVCAVVHASPIISALPDERASEKARPFPASYSVSHKRLHRYLREFEFRYNHRHLTDRERAVRDPRGQSQTSNLR